MSQDNHSVLVQKHAKYCLRFLHLLPSRLSSHDSTRVTIAFFAVSGLDVLDALSVLSDPFKQDIIAWVYRLQVIPRDDMPAYGGIQGSSTINLLDVDDNCCANLYKWGHLAMTYTGIAVLVALGDDLSQLDRKKIIEGVSACQRENGSFSASVEGTEHDMRFVYCAACICTMLNDWTGIDKQKMAQYIMDSIRYDYGISQHNEMESHGGTTFCAIAALKLSNQLDTLPRKTIEKMKRWLIFRQDSGFCGRPNKPTDTCYSFWIGAALKILGAFELTDFGANREYIMSTQDITIGGFSKWPGSSTDPFHTYFGLCGLSFLNEPSLLEVEPCLNISMRAYQRLKEMHKLWSLEQKVNDVKLF